MFMFFPSYKLPFLRGWSIATVDYREYIQKTTNPQVTRLVMNRLLSASLRQCWAVPIIEYIGIFGSSLSMQPSGKKKNICNSWVVLRCFEYASTSSINSPTTINPRPTFPTKKVALATGRPSDWLVRSLAQKTSTNGVWKTFVTWEAFEKWKNKSLCPNIIICRFSF